MSHADIADRKIYKSLQYYLKNDKAQGIYDPTAKRLSVNDVYEIYHQQKGRCYWSNVPMRFPGIGTSIFQISVDRVDCSKGHTKDNIVLVCLGTNLARNASKTEDLVEWLDAIKDNHNEEKL